jgi:hypothetical protein
MFRNYVYLHSNLTILLKLRREKNLFIPLGISFIIRSAVGFSPPNVLAFITKFMSGQQCPVPSSSSQRCKWEMDSTTFGTPSIHIMGSFQSWSLKKRTPKYRKNKIRF